MKRRIALFLSLLLTALIAVNITLLGSKDNYKEVYVERVIDGDTFESNNQKFRLVNVNTPEKSEKGYTEAKDFLSQIENTSVKVDELSTDKYGRTLVRIYSPEYLNLELIKKGLATKFLVQDSELKTFDNAEKEAVQKGVGLWEKSEYFGCFDIDLLAEAEILRINVLCSDVDLQGFIVADESRKRYKFGSINSSEVNLHSAQGKNNETDLFWNNNGGIWNNDRDTIHIFDSMGKLAYHSSYGY